MHDSCLHGSPPPLGNHPPNHELQLVFVLHVFCVMGGVFFLSVVLRIPMWIDAYKSTIRALL